MNSLAEFAIHQNYLKNLREAYYTDLAIHALITLTVGLIVAFIIRGARKERNNDTQKKMSRVWKPY